MSASGFITSASNSTPFYSPKIHKITIPSESSYTKEEAIINQYNKEYSFDKVAITGCLPTYSAEDIEACHQKLLNEGLSKEIDWKGLQSDFSYLDITEENADLSASKVDYITSRYAVLKDRILRDYTGDEQKTQLDKLEGIFSDAKQTLADSYAKTVGGFFEGLGAAGESEKMRDSMLKGITARADEYSKYLEDNSGYADIAPGEEWLLNDDGYMGAQLRSSAESFGKKTYPSDNTLRSSDEKSIPAYSLKDLGVAGTYAKQTMQQFDSLNYRGSIPDEERLGLDLAVQAMKTAELTKKSGISSSMAALLNQSFDTYVDQFLDRVDENLKKDSDRSSISGLGREIRRETVKDIYEYTMKQYEETDDIMAAITEGARYGKQSFEERFNTDTKGRSYADKEKLDNFSELTHGPYSWNASKMSEMQKYSITIEQFLTSLNHEDPKNINLILGQSGDSSSERYSEHAFNTSV